jgi:putative peptidoglycan lipid II flippase
VKAAALLGSSLVKQAVVAAQNRALDGGLLIALPAAVALALLSRPIVSVLFQRGAFGPEDAVATADVLVGLAAGLPFAVVGKVVSQTFFARHDVRTPLLAGVAGMLVALLGTAVLAQVLGALGIGLGIALGFAAHSASLVIALRRAGLWGLDHTLARRAAGALAATLAMGVGLVAAEVVLDRLFGAALPRSLEVLRLIALCLAGLSLYAAAARALGAIGRKDLALFSKSP